MYEFSRAIFREIASDIIEDPHADPNHPQPNHERVLRACESAVLRLATDRHYFAKPARTLFNDIRAYFPMSCQLHVLHVVEQYIRAADEFILSQPPTGYDMLGNRVQCRASTRKGTPCQRIPLPHNGYCPSHQHLAETEELELAA
jgi:hypothetical protein